MTACCVVAHLPLLQEDKIRQAATLYELIVQTRIKPESIDTSSQIISGTLAGTHS